MDTVRSCEQLDYARYNPRYIDVLDYYGVMIHQRRCSNGLNQILPVTTLPRFLFTREDTDGVH